MQKINITMILNKIITKFKKLFKVKIQQMLMIIKKINKIRMLKKLNKIFVKIQIY